VAWRALTQLSWSIHSQDTPFGEVAVYQYSRANKIKSTGLTKSKIEPAEQDCDHRQNDADQEAAQDP
jgi:hypothetical protein